MSSTQETAAQQWQQLWLKNKSSTYIHKKKRRKYKKQKTQENNQKNPPIYIYNQTTITGENLTAKDEDLWGDNHLYKHPDVIRIGSQNIRGLSPYTSGLKNQQIIDTINEKKSTSSY